MWKQLGLIRPSFNLLDSLLWEDLQQSLSWGHCRFFREFWEQDILFGTVEKYYYCTAVESMTYNRLYITPGLYNSYWSKLPKRAQQLLQLMQEIAILPEINFWWHVWLSPNWFGIVFNSTNLPFWGEILRKSIRSAEFIYGRIVSTCTACSYTKLAEKVWVRSSL